MRLIHPAVYSASWVLNLRRPRHSDAEFVANSDCHGDRDCGSHRDRFISGCWNLSRDGCGPRLGALRADEDGIERFDDRVLVDLRRIVFGKLAAQNRCSGLITGASFAIQNVC